MKALTVKIGADTAQFTKGMDTMKRKTKSTASSIKGTMAKVFAGGLLVAGIRSLGTDLDRAGKLAQRFGESAVTIQKLGVVAELNGTSFERMSKALTDANRAAEEGLGGMQRQADAFDAMGINAQDFIGMGLQEQLTALSDGFILADKSGQGFSSAQIIMGGSAKELIPTLRQGTEAINAQALAASAASDATVDSVQEINDSWTRAKNTMLGYVTSVIGKLGKTIPLFVRVGDAISNAITLQIDIALGSVLRLVEALKRLASGDMEGAKLAIQSIGTNAIDSVAQAHARIGANNKKMADALIDNDIKARTKAADKSDKRDADREKKKIATNKRIQDIKQTQEDEENAKNGQAFNDSLGKSSAAALGKGKVRRGTGQEISSLASHGGGRGMTSVMGGLTKAALQGNKILTGIHNELKKPQGGLA